MSIQANINQITSLAALMFTQTPQYKAAAEKRTELGKIAQEEETLAKREAVAAEMGPTETRRVVGLANEKAELAHRKYKLDPSVSTWEAYEASGREAQRLADTAAEGERRNTLTDVAAAYDEAGNVARYYTQGELEDYMAEQEAMVAEAERIAKFERPRTTADEALAAEQINKRITQERKMGYQSPVIRQWADMGRKEKHQITTQLEKEIKNEKKEEQRNG